MSGIEGIRARVEAFRSHGTPGARAPQDRADLLGILDQIASVTDDARTVHGRLSLRDDIKRILGE